MSKDANLVTFSLTKITFKYDKKIHFQLVSSMFNYQKRNLRMKFGLG